MDNFQDCPYPVGYNEGSTSMQLKMMSKVKLLDLELNKLFFVNASTIAPLRRLDVCSKCMLYVRDKQRYFIALQLL